MQRQRGQLKTREGLKILGFVAVIGMVVILIIIWSGR